jgi:hypothetical protein
MLSLIFLLPGPSGLNRELLLAHYRVVHSASVSHSKLRVSFGGTVPSTAFRAGEAAVSTHSCKRGSANRVPQIDGQNGREDGKGFTAIPRENKGIDGTMPAISNPPWIWDPQSRT